MLCRWPLTYLLLLSVFAVPIFSQEGLPIRLIQDNDLGREIYNWSNDTIYLLDGMVYLERGGQLVIEQGTLIKARSRPSTGEESTALIIAAGALLKAGQEFGSPVIFTAEEDDLEQEDDLRWRDKGLWGGLIICGEADIYDPDQNRALPGLIAEPRNLFGGSDNSSSSGYLYQVSIRHAGAPVSKEISTSLLLAGLGNTSVIKGLEIFASGGDGVQLIGGNLDMENLIILFSSDHQLRWSSGWSGKLSNFFSIHDEDQLGYTLYASGGLKEIGPVLKPEITWATVIGPGRQQGAASPFAAFRFENGDGANIDRALIADFPQKAISLNDTKPPFGESSLQQFIQGNFVLNNTLWGGIGEHLEWNLGMDRAVDVPSDTDLSVRADVIARLRSGNNFMLDTFPVKLIDRSGDQPIFNNNIQEYLYCVPSAACWFNPDPFSAFSFGGIVGDLFVEQDFSSFFPKELIEKGALPTYLKQDTILTTCEMVDAFFSTIIDTSHYKCRYFFDSFPLVSSVSKRGRRRLREERSGTDSLPCYYLEAEWGNVYVFDTIISRENTLAVIDQTPPNIVLSKYDSIFPFQLELYDCDTAWLLEQSEEVFSDRKEYTWTATDFCGNKTTLTLIENPSLPLQTWYQDFDGDGFGNAAESIEWSTQPPGYVDNEQDCDDLDPHINPAATEVDNNLSDDDCDGLGDFLVCEGALFVPVSEFGSFTTLDNGKRLSEPDVFEEEFWVKTMAPPSGNIAVSVKREEHENVHFRGYRGECNSLIPIEGTQDFGFISELALTDLVPGEEIFIRVNRFFSLDAFLEIGLFGFEQVPNEECDNAIELSLDNDLAFNYSRVSAPFSFNPVIDPFSNEGCLPSLSYSYELHPFAKPDCWFKFQTEDDQAVVILSDYNFSVSKGGCENMEPVGCGYGKFVIQKPEAGVDYFIQVLVPYDNLTMTPARPNLRVKKWEPAVNDRCEDARDLAATQECSGDTFTNEGAGFICIAMSCPVALRDMIIPTSDYDVWFRTTMPETGELAVSLEPEAGSAFQNPILEAFTAGCDQPVPIDCDRPGEEAGAEIRIGEEVPPGSEVFLRVVERHNREGSFNLCVKDRFSDVMNPTSAEETATDDLSRLRVFPNPSSHQINLEYRLKKNTSLSIRLLDINGQVLRNLKEVDALAAGDYREKLDFGNLSSGFYLLSIQTNTGTISKKIILIK